MWIQRINAAARERGISYSRLIAGLKKENIEIDRRVLADLALNEREAFDALAERAKAAGKVGKEYAPKLAAAPVLSEFIMEHAVAQGFNPAVLLKKSNRKKKTGMKAAQSRLYSIFPVH